MKKMKMITALLTAVIMLLPSVAVMGAEEILAESPNEQLTTTEPLAESDNLLPKAKEFSDIYYSDVSGHWAEDVIKMLTAGNYLQSDGGTEFRPENNVTRAEFVTMALNALKVKRTAYTGGIDDVSSDDWYANEIGTALSEKIISDALLTDGMFNPESAVVREDAAVIIAAAAERLGAENGSVAVGFVGQDEPSEYAAESVAKTVAWGIMQGDPDGSLRLRETLTRAEAAEMLAKTIGLTDRLAIYVDPENGNDDGTGIKSEPVATIDAAIRLVKENNSDMKNHLFVFLKSGQYYIEDEIKLDTAVSGSNGYNVVFTSYGKEKAQLMMGKEYGGFELYDETLGIYRTYVGDTMSRQVYINGVRGIRARSDCELTNAELVEEYGFISDDTFLAEYKNIKDLEMVSYSIWTQPRCGVSEVRIEDGRAKIIMDEEAWPTGLGSNNTPWELPYWYENAYELLNTAGEWYIDSTDGYLYYIPRPFEDPETMVATIPVGERILTLEGTVDEPIHNITFEGLEFAYTTWMRPSSELGFNENQNNAIDGKLSETAVQAECARYVDFINNKFSRLGSSGLYMFHSIQECDVIGNEFADISSIAFSLGWGQGDNYETEIKPSEYKYYTINNKFNNNYVHDIAVEYGAASAVSATFPKYTQFNHNEITNTVYSGFHIGWLWETYSEEAEKKGTGFYKVQVNNNYVHEVETEYVYDGGCIYLCGTTGGTYENYSECMNNFLQNSRNAHGALYLEAGSTYWRAENNLIDLSEVEEWPKSGRETPDTPKWLTTTNASSRYNVVKDNYATTINARKDTTYNYIEDPALADMNNLPEEANAIIYGAGLMHKYLERYPAPAQRLTVNYDEVVAKIGDTVQLETNVYGRNNSVPDKDDYSLYYTSSDPSVASVDENGLVTINAKGRARVYVNLYADGIVRTKQVDLICGDKLAVVKPDKMNLLAGYYSTPGLTAASEFGRDLEVEAAEYTSLDESVVTVDEDGNFHGVSAGTAKVHGVFAAEDTTLEADIAVTVHENYAKDGSEKLEGKALPSSIYNSKNWASARIPGVEVATVAEDGKSVTVTAESSYYTKEKLRDGLYSFDLKIEDPSISWPSLAFKVGDTATRYVNGDCYLIGFNEDYVELQRFNQGSCTYFLGAESRGAGIGVPNYGGQILEYGKTYHITAGTIEEKDGVRIILNVDGKNIIDYLDSGEGCLRGDGYFGVYAGATGKFILSEYTGK